MYSTDDVCAIIVSFNGGFQIIEHVRRLSEIIKKVLVVDNGSNIKNLNYLHSIEQFDGVEVIYNNENKGIAYALNQGIVFAKKNGFKLLLTLDQDSEISEECINKLVKAIDVKNKVVSVGPVYGKVNAKQKEIRDVSFLITSGNLIYVDVVNMIGGYATELFIDCVDIDLSFNLVSHGYRLQKIENACMQHKIGEYENSFIFHIPHLAHNPKRYYYKYRNNIIIYKKYSKKLFFLCLKLFISLCLEFQKIIFIENKKKEKIIYALHGIRDGIRYHR